MRGGAFHGLSLQLLAECLPPSLTSLSLRHASFAEGRDLAPALAELAARLPGLRKLALVAEGILDCAGWRPERSAWEQEWVADDHATFWNGTHDEHKQSLAEVDLAAFTALRHLELTRAPLIELPAGLAALPLTHLSLRCDAGSGGAGCELGPALQALGGSLRELWLWDWAAPFAVAAQRGHTAAFAALTRLTALFLDVTATFDQRPFPRLAAAALPPRLEHLFLRGAYLKAVDPLAPPGLLALRQLVLGTTAPGVKDLRRAAAFSGLTSLCLQVNTCGRDEQCDPRALAEVRAGRSCCCRGRSFVLGLQQRRHRACPSTLLALAAALAGWTMAHPQPAR